MLQVSKRSARQALAKFEQLQPLWPRCSCSDKLTAGFGLTLRLHDRLYCLRKIAKQTLRSVNFALPFTGFSGIVPAF